MKSIHLSSTTFFQGTKEITCGVDEETGDIFLSFEACEVSELSKFIWSKSYKEITESKRVTASAVGRTCVVLNCGC